MLRSGEANTPGPNYYTLVTRISSTIADKIRGRHQMTTDTDDIDFGQPDDTGISLERKYQEQMRQIVSQKIELPISTLPSMIKEQIDLKPEFQRRGRWDIERRSQFIESIIMNVPIPPVFLGEDDYGKYEVLDGRQRLTAVFEFMRNTYSLKNLDVWTELNGNTFADLQEEKLDRLFTRRFIPAVIVLKESSPQVKYDVFDRLNTGGVVALPMEIRNAVFPGKFNRLLHKLSETREFRLLWSIPEDSKQRDEKKLYQTMGDLELVLRFFAIPRYQGKMMLKDWLTDFLDERNKAYERKADLEQEDVELFQRAARNCFIVFGETAFSRPSGKTLPSSPEASRPDQWRIRRRKQKSAPLADAVMNSLAGTDTARLTPDICARIRRDIDVLCLADLDFIKAITSGTNGIGAIQTRLRKAAAVVDSHLP